MPIVDIEKTKQLEFGYGDINVAPGLLALEGESIGVVAFMNNSSRDRIGKYTEYPENTTIQVTDTPVRMLFEKVESIDVVIRAFESAKAMMIKGATKL
ncbi:Uncharacterised protein [Niallia circulans]|uniref:hypothetical protein n=1 Tax=Niallia circulans TaxID=1397 RepID=UPI00077C233D|nr:hypothetical protein [Niallia circulans]MDR4315010.1 hypothetical protein [Niallia circulans]MED3839735.1 hypothetical protein [Niallia circulans]MED4241221.1 hypothetical protein [Niallia circulans]MED4247882.1 hypothetical protein [Niallia circulans]QKH61636.1 hypothetical protein FOC77_13750 [Niallia circulans]